MAKYSEARLARWHFSACVLHAGHLNYRHTLRICNIYWVFTAKIVAQTLLSVTSTYTGFPVAEEEHVSPGFREHRRVATIRSYERIHTLHSDLNDAMLKTISIKLKTACTKTHDGHVEVTTNSELLHGWINFDRFESLSVVIELRRRNYDCWGKHMLVSPGHLPYSDPCQTPHFDPKVKEVNFTLKHAMRAQRGRRGIALHFFNVGARSGWVVDATPRPLYPRGESRSTHCTAGKLGPWDGLDRCGGSCLTEHWSPDIPARSESLHRLRYSDPLPWTWGSKFQKLYRVK